MNGPQKRQRHRCSGGEAVAKLKALYGTNRNTPRLPERWRERLPDPETYYRAHVAKLGKGHGNGWAQGQCPFHEDRNASLSVNLAQPRGFWKCFAGCGSGDMVSFHMKLTGLPFADSARALLGGRP